MAVERLLVERRTTAAQRLGIVVVLLLCLLAVNFLEYLTPAAFRMVLLAGIVPVIGALVLTMHQTALLATLALLSVGIAYGTRSYGPDNLDEAATGIALMVTTGFASLLIARLGLARTTRLEHARSTAEVVQLALLRPLPLRTKTVEVHGVYLAADEYARVGGDLYEVLETPYGTRVIVADVRGKGLDAINASATVLSAFRVTGYEEPSLPRLADRMEAVLDRYNEYALSVGQEERHVTALLLERADDGRMMCVNCGHLDPLAVGPAGVRALDLGEAGLPLGFGALVADPYRPAVPVRVEDGELLVMFTDGVSEARNAAGAFYPLDERLAQWTALPPGALLRALGQDLGRYVEGSLQDDVTLLVVAARPVPTEP